MSNKPLLLLTGLVIGLMFSMALFPGGYAQAQDGDTLVVDWTDADGNIKINALRDAILGDTTDSGERANTDRVYKLKAGGFYWNSATISADFPLRIVGEKFDTENTHKPILAAVTDEDANFPNPIIETTNGATLRNFRYIATSPSGNSNWYSIQFNGDNTEVMVDNLIIEYWPNSVIAVNGKGVDFTLKNTLVRNLIDHGVWWGGRTMETWGDDTEVRYENNTFFNVHSAVFQDSNNDESLWFNHNTIVNTVRDAFFFTTQPSHMIVANNLWVNTGWAGETIIEDFSQERILQGDMSHASYIPIDSLDPSVGFDQDRIMGLFNNATWRDPEFQNYYDAYNDTASTVVYEGTAAETENELRPRPWLNERAENMFSGFDSWKREGHIAGVNPNFENYPDIASDMVEWVTKFRAGEEANTSLFYDAQQRIGDLQDPNNIDWQSIHQNVAASSPVPENFKYSNSQLMEAATGGYPVGDLNWFPDKKAQWEGEKESLEQQIRDKFSDVAEPFEPLSTVEAEAGTVEGDGVSVKADTNINAIRMEGSGSINWEFELEAAGTYTVAIEFKERFGNADRVQDVQIVHGEDTTNAQIGGFDTGGEFEYGHIDSVEVDFVEGTNEINVINNWGYHDFRNVEIRDGETVVKTLTPGDADLVGGPSYLSDVPVASGGRFVAFEQDGQGSLTWNFDGLGFENQQDGEFRFQFNARAIDGASGTVQDVYVNGEAVMEDLDFSVGEDFETFTTDFTYLEEGLNSLAIHSQDGNIDVDQAIVFGRPGQTTSIDEMAETPSDFELKQNYPNPFNPSTTIQYQLAEASDVQLTVYNVLGQQVATLVNTQQSAGLHSVRFDASNLASGVYFYRLKADDFTTQKQMMLVK